MYFLLFHIQFSVYNTTPLWYNCLHIMFSLYHVDVLRFSGKYPVFNCFCEKPLFFLLFFGFFEVISDFIRYSVFRFIQMICICAVDGLLSDYI